MDESERCNCWNGIKSEVDLLSNDYKIMLLLCSRGEWLVSTGNTKQLDTMMFVLHSDPSPQGLQFQG